MRTMTDIVLVLMFLGLSLPGQAQVPSVLDPRPAITKRTPADGQSIPAAEARRLEMTERLLNIIKGLKRAGPPPPDCMEG